MGAPRRDRGQRVLGAGADADVGDAARRHERPRREVRRGGADVGDLRGRRLDVAWLAAAVAPPGEVERERRVPAPGQLDRIAAGHLLLHRQPRAGDDDTRPALEQIAGAVEPPGEPDTTRWEHRRGDGHVEHGRNGNVFVLTGLRILPTRFDGPRPFAITVRYGCAPARACGTSSRWPRSCTSPGRPSGSTCPSRRCRGRSACSNATFAVTCSCGSPAPLLPDRGRRRAPGARS